MSPAPTVGFNLTYVCPEGFVFSHDWFATPFIMMTCQVWKVEIFSILYIHSRILESLMHQTGRSMSVYCVSKLFYDGWKSLKKLFQQPQQNVLNAQQQVSKNHLSLY